MMPRPAALLMLVAVSAAVVRGAPQVAEETLAQRLFQQAKNFVTQGNYREALGDLQRVVDTYPKSSVADNALLELARYYLDIANEPSRAATLVEQIKSAYLTTESAPEAFVLAGRIALARSHRPADLETAFAQFDRVPGLFPESPAVASALTYAGESRRLARRQSDALDRFQRVTVEYDASPAAAGAHLGIAMVLAEQGDVTGAMEEFQRVRNHWPQSREAGLALDRASILFRLYVRAKSGPAYAPTSDPIGPPKADNVRAIVTTGDGTVYYATESAVGPLTPSADKLPLAARPRGLSLDAARRLVIIEGNMLKPLAGPPLVLTIPQTGKAPRPLDKITAAIVTSSGEWLVADDDEKAIHRFDPGGRHVGQWAAVHASRLAIDEFDDVAAIDRDSKTVVLLEPAGRIVARIVPRGPGYEMPNPEDVSFDVFGHVYVLDRTSVLVFDAKKGLGAASGANTPARPAGMPVLTIYGEPEKSVGAIRRGTAFALDNAGQLYIADDRAQKIQLYR